MKDTERLDDSPDVIGVIGAVPLPTLSDALLSIAAHIELDATEEAQQEAAVLRQAASALKGVRERALEPLRHIAKVGCMNRPGDDIWCKDDHHSVYCPAGIAIAALKSSSEEKQ